MFYSEELNATFLHIPKCGGVYVRTQLFHYGFKYNDDDFNNHKTQYDFIEDESHYNSDKDKYCNSIRTKGKYRYFLTHQNTNVEKLMNSFKFTFVRNPYEKLLSAYKYVERLWYINQTDIPHKTHKTPENYEYLIDFDTFIKNYKNINNISYSHAFISQYDQLCDFSGNIHFDYIGKTESLDDDLIRILFLLGVNTQRHLREPNDNIQCNVSTYEKPIYEYYNEDIFHFVNNHFNIDFARFGYKMFTTFDEFKSYYKSEYINNKETLELQKKIKYVELPYIIPKRTTNNKTDEIMNTHVSLSNKEHANTSIDDRHVKIEDVDQNINSHNEYKIPKQMVQLWPTNMVNREIYDKLMEGLNQNREYSYHFVNEEFGKNLIHQFFDSKTQYAFHQLHKNVDKLFFIRYAYLYIYGGIYLDMGTTILDSLNDFIGEQDEYVFIITNNETISQKCISIMPGHPIMKQMVNEITNRILMGTQLTLLYTDNRLITEIIRKYIITQTNISKQTPEQHPNICMNYNSGPGKIVYKQTCDRYML